MSRKPQPVFATALAYRHGCGESGSVPDVTSRQQADPHCQRGFGLLELMVAMTISLFLLGGLYSIFYSTRQTSTAQTSLSQLQDKQRLAMTLLAGTIQSAGYYTNLASGAAVLPAISSLSQGQSLFGTDGGSQPDQIRVRFQTKPNDGVMNCQGVTNTGGSDQVYDNLFSINIIKSNSQLQCSVNGGSPVTLVDSVTNLKFLYGIDSTNNGLSANQYVTASSVTNWNQVRSVRATLTFTQSGLPTPVPFSQVIQLMGRDDPP